MLTHPWKSMIAAATLLAAGACSVQKPPPPVVEVAAERSPRGGAIEQTTTLTATVQSINQRTRRVTLRGPDGRTITTRVSPDVRNLAQVRRGDLVSVVFFEAIAYEVRKKGSAKPGVDQATEVGRAPIGQRPAAGAANVIVITATIQSIDRRNQTVELKGPKGQIVSVKVKDPSRLDQVKVGDVVEIAYTEAVAISVDPAPRS